MVYALALLALGTGLQQPKLLGADEVLKRLKANEAKMAAQRKEAEKLYGGVRSELPPSYQKQVDLRIAIQSFQAEAANLDAATAASRWLKFFDETIMLGSGIEELVTALPETDTWPAISEGIEKRMANKTSLRGAGFRIFGTLMTDNVKAQQNSLASAMALASNSKSPQRAETILSLNSIQLTLAKRRGEADWIKASLRRNAANAYRELDLDDETLAALGPDKEAFLDELFRTAKSPLSYSVYYFDTPNGKLVYDVAVRTAPSHKAPHWGVAERMSNQTLYEAIAKRFNPFTKWPPVPKGKKPSVDMYGYGADSGGASARTYYLFSLAKAGKIDQAMKGVGDASSMMLDYSFNRNQKPDKNTFEFVRRVLTAHPKAPLWETFEVLNMAVGMHQVVLTTADSGLKSTALNAEQRGRVLHARESALLALDRIDEAFASMMQRYAIEVKNTGRSSSEEAFHRIKKLAELLGRKDWTKVVDEKLSKGKYANENRANPADLVKREAALVSELGGRYLYGGGVIGSELIQIYAAANRPKDVIRIAEAEGIWAQSDIRDVYEIGSRYMTQPGADSISVLLGKALLNEGRTEEAHRIAFNNVKQNLGVDAAYEFLIQCKSSTLLEDLDKLATLNQFEERPLIWKAKVLLDEGKLDEAEKTIKAAIEIDPSDGEQPHGRRMFGYSVYADILAKKGDADQSNLYRGAVRAIRLAERADDFLIAGLYGRAIKMYDQALTVFGDAYCIQSRLAVNLAQAGRMEEAIVHYRRAYELMVDSFGFVETHCFGCEQAFEGETQQSLAEEVFTKILQERPNKPQVHYLLGYLRESQNRTDEAVGYYKRAVELDPRYLNAWKRLSAVGRTSLSHEEIKSIDAQIAGLEPRVATNDPTMGWFNYNALTFAEAYEKASKKLIEKREPLFKLKAKPRPAGMDEDFMYMGRGSGDVLDGPTTPGAAILQTSVYGNLRLLLSGY